MNSQRDGVGPRGPDASHHATTATYTPVARRLTPEQRRLRIALLAFSTVVVSGFIGYQILLDLRPLDALYMTVITITTVGFREVVELTDAAKVLTIGLIAAGVGSASYAAVTAAEFVVEGHLRQIIERRRMERTIEDLRDHIIVCGFGRVGRHLVEALQREGEPFVVIDSEHDKVAYLESAGYTFIAGDATEELVLESAGLDRARALVACVNSDADNVLVTLTAKGMAPGIDVIARAKADENENKLRRAGADRVISPSTIGGRRIAQLLTRPVVADFLQGIGVGGIDFTFEEVPVVAGSELDGTTLGAAGIRERYSCTVIAIRGEDGLDSHPNAQTELHAGDTLVVMGKEDVVLAMREQFTAAKRPRGGRRPR